MRKVILVLLILLIIAIIVIVGLLITGFIPLQSEGSPILVTQPSQTPYSNPPSPTGSIPVPYSNPPSPADAIPPSRIGEVKFEFEVTDVSGSGLSRTVTAQVTNAGDGDAHNVWGKVEVFSQGSRIKFGGKEFIRVDVGTLRAGETIITGVNLSFGLSDGLKISQNGATFVLTIYSDEITETFFYDYST